MTTLPARLKILGVLLLACLGGVLSARLCHRTSRESSPPEYEDTEGPDDVPPPCPPDRHEALARLLVGISRAYLGSPDTRPKRPSP